MKVMSEVSPSRLVVPGAFTTHHGHAPNVPLDLVRRAGANRNRVRCAAITPSPIDPDALPRSQHAHELVGAQFDLPISLILVHCAPGTGPAVHRHPYPEVFVIEDGQATFHVDGAEFVGGSGQIVIAPANAAHGFTNTGTGELRLTAIHAAGEFTTQWLGPPDPAWVSPDLAK
jgi:quercetin dioxygenase-like cupin family protein